MRYQGRITVWKDERGFGFITPNSGNESVFVHVSAFARGARRPTDGDRVTYERVPDDKRRYRAVNVAYTERRGAARPTRRRSCISAADVGSLSPVPARESRRRTRCRYTARPMTAAPGS